jgi:hypothetical protein
MKSMCLKKRLGQLLGVSDQAVARWEKRRGSIEPLADRLVRIIYGEWRKGASAALDLVKWMAEADQVEASQVCLEKTPSAWRVSETRRAA